MQPKPIRSFTRGLAILAALNRHGSASVLTLAAETGLPRATIYRLLQSLLDEGYIGRGAADDRFHLRFKVKLLSGGFRDEHWISTVAGPALVELTQRISWPCDIVTLDGLKMIIRDTTHPMAPLSIDHNVVGRKLPILGSASGLAYLAFAPAPERAALLDMLAASDDADDALARDRAQAERLIATARRRGYAGRQGGAIWPHTGAVALPIRSRRRVLGCISVIWMARAIAFEDGMRRCLEPLRATRLLIEQRLASDSDGVSG
jgi:IclR family mhp operon transcriptional activator